jgi:ParB-like chromosome segregation protein Spo0J
VRNLTDREFLEVQLLENLQRVDVRPADEATAFAKLLASNFSAEEIAQRVGKPVKFVLQRAKLVTLIPFWMELLEVDRLPLVAAHELARLPAHSQVVVKKEIDGTWEFKQGKVLDPQTLRNTINSKVLRKLDQVAWPLNDATLYPEAGPCTKCPKRSGACRGLFDDLQQEGKPDNCLDAACFTKKTELFVQRRRIELAGTDTPLLSGTSWESKGAIIGFGYYSSAQEGEKGAVLALVVDGFDAGKTRWVKIKTASSAAKDSKAEREASIRKNRIARQANELKADLLRELFNNQLSGQGGAGIHALLNHFIKHRLEYGRSRTPNAMLEYLQVQYGWEAPTEADLNTQTNPTQTWIDGDLNTPHRAYLVRQLAKMPLVADKILLYFDLKFRNGLEQSEVLQVQDTLIKRLPLSLQDEFNVTAKATQLVEERFYQKKGKKQEVTA